MDPADLGVTRLQGAAHQVHDMLFNVGETVRPLPTSVLAAQAFQAAGEEYACHRRAHSSVSATPMPLPSPLRGMPHAAAYDGVIPVDASAQTGQTSADVMAAQKVIEQAVLALQAASEAAAGSPDPRVQRQREVALREFLAAGEESPAARAAMVEVKRLMALAMSPSPPWPGRPVGGSSTDGHAAHGKWPDASGGGAEGSTSLVRDLSYFASSSRPGSSSSLAVAASHPPAPAACSAARPVLPPLRTANLVADGARSHRRQSSARFAMSARSTTRSCVSSRVQGSFRSSTGRTPRILSSTPNSSRHLISDAPLSESTKERPDTSRRRSARSDGAAPPAPDDRIEDARPPPRQDHRAGETTTHIRDQTLQGVVPEGQTPRGARDWYRQRYEAGEELAVERQAFAQTIQNKVTEEIVGTPLGTGQVGGTARGAPLGGSPDDLPLQVVERLHNPVCEDPRPRKLKQFFEHIIAHQRSLAQDVATPATPSSSNSTYKPSQVSRFVRNGSRLSLHGDYKRQDGPARSEHDGDTQLPVDEDAGRRASWPGPQSSLRPSSDGNDAPDARPSSHALHASRSAEDGLTASECNIMTPAGSVGGGIDFHGVLNQLFSPDGWPSAVQADSTARPPMSAASLRRSAALDVDFGGRSEPWANGASDTPVAGLTGLSGSVDLSGSATLSEEHAAGGAGQGGPGAAVPTEGAVYLAQPQVAERPTHLWPPAPDSSGSTLQSVFSA